MKRLKSEIEAVLFDKDGTLIDFPTIWIPWVEDIYNHLHSSLPDCHLSLVQLKKAFGVHEGNIDPNSPLTVAGSEESITIIAFLLYELGIPWEQAVTFATAAVTIANSNQNNSPYLQPVRGIERLLIELKEAGVTMGVLTSDDTDKAEKQLEKLGLASYFQFVIGSDQVKQGKPFPDMAYLARDRYGIHLANAMMVGDTGADIELGKRAGVKSTVGIITYAKGETEHLKEADQLIEHYDELLLINKEQARR